MCICTCLHVIGCILVALKKEIVALPPKLVFFSLRCLHINAPGNLMVEKVRGWVYPFSHVASFLWTFIKQTAHCSYVCSASEPASLRQEPALKRPKTVRSQSLVDKSSPGKFVKPKVRRLLHVLVVSIVWLLHFVCLLIFFLVCFAVLVFFPFFLFIHSFFFFFFYVCYGDWLIIWTLEVAKIKLNVIWLGMGSNRWWKAWKFMEFGKKISRLGKVLDLSFF